MSDRIKTALNIIDYAIQNKIGIKEASKFYGFSETYVKNVKADVLKKFEKGSITQEQLNHFLSKYKEYFEVKKIPNFKPNLRSSIKEKNTSNLQNVEDTEDFDTYCKTHKIDPNDVITYWHKSNHYSIYLRNSQDKLNQKFEILKEILKQETKPVLREKRNLLSNDKDNCAVINIFDLHIDKKAYNSAETGINEVIRVKEEIKTAFEELLQSTLIHRPNTIYFPIGNDLLNTNGFISETVRGTPQKVLVEHDAAFRQALDLCKYMVDRLIEETNSQIIIPIISGNHDKFPDFYIGICLEIMYHNNPNVIINNEIKDDRKYYIFEDILFAFMHGEKYLNKLAQLPTLIMQENRINLSKTKFTQAYLGDQHHRQEFKFLRTKDFPGCNVTFLRGSGVSDGWSQDYGYVEVPRTIESFIWKKEKGQIANYSINL